MERKIYITHCSAKKLQSLKLEKKKVAPDQLYTSSKIQRFIQACKKKRVEWAIFSDLYGIYFPNEKHEWYEKHPNKVSEEEFKELLKDFDERLGSYHEIWFYYHPARFHPLYRKLIRKSQYREKIKLFSKIQEIT